jgi:Tfp pilus assembly protein PilN
MVSFSRSKTTDVVDDEGVVAAPPAPMSPSVAAFPRVNLIPDKIAEEHRVHRAKLVLGGAALASVVAVGALYLMAAGEVSSAQEDLDTANARGVTLASQVATYAEVPTVRAQVQAAQMQQYQAMGGEVRWSFLLNNLALTIPNGTSLTTFKGTITGVPPTAGADAQAAGSGTEFSVLGRPGVGAITYEGEAKSYALVASFLDSIAKQKTLLDPYASNASIGEQQRTGVADGSVATAPQGFVFASSATVSPQALSHRYDLKAGN